MGRVAGSYGVRGWVKVAPQAGVQESLAAAKQWWLDGEPRRVETARVHSATVIAKLEGIESREQALALKGRPVSLPREALPQAGEGHYYLADLLGLEVVNAQGVSFGVVRQWLTNGPQDVMEVAGDRTRLLPWVPAVVKRVDLAAKRIEVAWESDW
ncbi:MAG: ribosome maturation factor RimM [Betaproteobacteria bacterium]|nr:ribosome maturation factor RimM [Betaproteobacteria bacterium]MDH4325112.1 ribosome maturation factor RimM [Betaproteobacteria bacterium]MDH5210476.1 ribosome maturation factor RimM [Betaproteobacteria bacterium]MDH5577569.1 ribosome maturation factor RimM [Betaproteobacteria bacterium]